MQLFFLSTSTTLERDALPSILALHEMPTSASVRYEWSGPLLASFQESLQREFIEVLHRDILEFVDEVLLDQQRFHFYSFFFPASLVQRKERAGVGQ